LTNGIIACCIELELEAYVVVVLEGQLLSPYIVYQHLEAFASMAQDRTMADVVPLLTRGLASMVIATTQVVATMTTALLQCVPLD
jgi:hypothetical protein